MSNLYKICVAVQKLQVNVLADWHVSGKENIPPPGGSLIVASNHLSQCDPSYLTISVNRWIRFLAKRELFENPMAGPLLYWYGAYPLNRGGVDITAYKFAMNLLKTDGTLALFPEGTRSPTGLRKGETGIVKLALASGAPILPVGITGTENFGNWSRGAFFPTGVVRVKIGKLFSLPVIEGKISNEVAQSLSDSIMQRISNLLPPEYQGVYPTPKRSKS